MHRRDQVNGQAAVSFYHESVLIQSALMNHRVRYGTAARQTNRKRWLSAEDMALETQCSPGLAFSFRQS
jgi:hypothetical protein